MDVYLARPGAKKLGPFTLSQINKDLADRKYKDTDYWAWSEGLPEWVPLYAVPGVISPSDSKAGTGDTTITTAPVTATAPLAQPPAASTPSPETTPAQAPVPKSVPEPSPAELQLASGMPLDALEQFFLLTNGDGREAMHSPLTARIVAEVAGAPFEIVRAKAPRDVIGHCSFVDNLRRDGAVPDAAWRAMAGLKPDLVQQAREGAYRICVRTFPINQQQSAALFLFYNKQKSGEQ